MANDELLSQDEIDALLSGVDNGEVDTDDSDGLGEAGSGDVNPFDFATQDRIVRGRMPTFEMINERFARNLATSLFNLLRQAPKISLEGTQMTKFSEYIHGLPVPSSLNIVKVDPLRGSGLIVLEPKLVFSLVDSYFGGDGKFEAKIEGREFTVAESRIVNRLLSECFTHLEEAWKPVYEVKFLYQNSENDPHFANVVTPSEVVAVSSFQIDLGIGSGAFHIVLPYSMLEPIRGILDADVKNDTSDNDSHWSERLQDEIKTAKVVLDSTLARTEITVSELLALKSGDVIPIELPDTVVASVGAVPVFSAKYGTSRGNVALRVVEFMNHATIAPLESNLGRIEQ